MARLRQVQADAVRTGAAKASRFAARRRGEWASPLPRFADCLLLSARFLDSLRGAGAGNERRECWGGGGGGLAQSVRCRTYLRLQRAGFPGCLIRMRLRIAAACSPLTGGKSRPHRALLPPSDLVLIALPTDVAVHLDAGLLDGLAVALKIMAQHTSASCSSPTLASPSSTDRRQKLHRGTRLSPRVQD